MAPVGSIVLGSLVALGIVLIAIGGGLIYVFKNKIHEKITQEIPLTNGSESFNTWEDPPAPVYMQFWMFHVENPYEVTHNPGTKAILTERGPYTYREIRPKVDVDFISNGTLLSYRQPKEYVFVPEKSQGHLENDTFTSVNLVVLTAVTQLHNWLSGSKFQSTIESGVAKILEMTGEKLFEEYTVGGYLWGYQEKTINEINNLIHKFKIPYTLQDTYGLFYGQNGTDDGSYTIYTGLNHLDKFNIIDEWKDNSSVEFWTTKYCNMINGTDGSSWHPFIEKSERLYLFSSDICRSIYIEYEREMMLKSIHLYRFIPPASVFARHEDNPDNAGFCTPNTNFCLNSGVLNVSNCKGAPIIMSQPHFYQGADRYLNAVKGLHPNKDEHQTFIDIEPYTGAAMRIAKRLQINAHIQSFKSFVDTKYIKSLIFPIAWLNESAVVSDKGSHTFHKEVLDPIKVTEAVQYGVMVLGAFILFCAVVLIIRKIVNKRSKDEPLLSESDPTI